MRDTKDTLGEKKRKEKKPVGEGVTVSLIK